jgi:hypothetical protein
VAERELDEETKAVSTRPLADHPDVLIPFDQQILDTLQLYLKFLGLPRSRSLHAALFGIGFYL